MARIDYQKAFEKVPHSWIIKSLELLGINDSYNIYQKGYDNLENMHVPTNRKLGFRNRRYKNTMWDIARRLTVTTVILHLFNSPY